MALLKYGTTLLGVVPAHDSTCYLYSTGSCPTATPFNTSGTLTIDGYTLRRNSGVLQVSTDGSTFSNITDSTYTGEIILLFAENTKLVEVGLNDTSDTWSPTGISDGSFLVQHGTAHGNHVINIGTTWTETGLTLIKSA